MTDKKLDTGTGGINIDDKVYTYDVGIENDDDSAAAWSGGDIKVDNTTRDISNSTKRTLAQYLSQTTLGSTNSVPDQAKGKGNRFTIPQDSVDVFHTTTAEGKPLGPQPAPNYSFYPELNDPKRDARNNLPNVALSTNEVSRGMIRTALPLPQQPGAGAPPTNAALIDGNDLFKFSLENNVIKDPHPLATYSSALVNNRWKASNQFGSKPTEDTLRKRPLAAIKYALGTSYEWLDTDNPKDPTVITVSHAQLAGVGNTLMARASTEITATDKDFDPANAGFQAAASLLPGFGQLGAARVSELVLQAKDVLERMDLTQADGDEPSPGIDAANLTSISPGITSALSFDAPLQSWGALNNPFDMFTGLGALGMQILSIAFVIAITIIPSAINIDLSAKPPPGGSLDEYSRMPIGRYKQTGKTIPNLSAGYLISGLADGSISWTSILGFGETAFPLGRCFAVGILAFFGLYKPKLDESGKPEISVGQTLKGAATLSGTEAYVIFSRSIIRSFLLLVDEIIKIGRAFANPAAGIQQLLGFIEFLRSSKLMRFLNTCGLLGDRMLLIDLRATDEKSKGFGQRSSSVDLKTTAGDAAYRKSRLIQLGPSGANASAKNLRLAWSSFRSPDMLILPKNLYAASLVDKDLGAPSLIPTVENDENVGTRNGEGTSTNLLGGVYSLSDKDDRISTEDRERFEQILNAEYMPFYFQDVRTNEIISFHAFLASLGDNYTAAYDSVDAFGRVESVKSYKSTSRKIDVSFHIAALSPEDFNYMWLKINKLTTLVYPQFTQGKIAETPNYKVTVPFSQQISAHPLVRLRIGDLIQSNYSRFNLARLFGYAYGSDKYTDTGDAKGADGAKAFNGVKLDDLKSIDAKIAEQKKPGNTFTSTGELNFTTKPEEPRKSYMGTPQYLRLKIDKVVDDPKAGTKTCECTVEINKDMLDKLGKDEAAKLRDSLKQKYGSADQPNNILDQKCTVKFDDLIPTDETLNKARQSIGLTAVATYQGAVESFMNRPVNSIVRSFETSGGRGMPGFIESMGFDWYSGVTWEEDITLGRAPKMCKVTITFSPFHDITPGLDSKGFNRAPIYPLGALSRKNKK